VQDKLDSARITEGEKGPKSEDDNIEALSGEGDTSQKNWRDRARDLSDDAPVTNQDQGGSEIEVW